LELTGDHAQFGNIQNFVTRNDPGFIDAKKMNFQLRKDSIVFQKLPSFKNIPFDKIGTFDDNYRKDK